MIINRLPKNFFVQEKEEEKDLDIVMNNIN
jgi:hypothetical protein